MFTNFLTIAFHRVNWIFQNFHPSSCLFYAPHLLLWAYTDTTEVINVVNFLEYLLFLFRCSASYYSLSIEQFRLSRQSAMEQWAIWFLWALNWFNVRSRKHISRSNTGSSSTELALLLSFRHSSRRLLWIPRIQYRRCVDSSRFVRLI